MPRTTRHNAAPRSDRGRRVGSRHSWRPALAVAVLVSLVLGIGSCGGDDLLIGTNIPPTLIPLTPTPQCLRSGASCTRSQDCCSGVCFTGTNTCT